MNNVTPASVAIEKVASRAKVWVELTSGAMGCVVRSGKDDLSWAVLQMHGMVWTGECPVRRIRGRSRAAQGTAAQGWGDRL